MKFQRASDYSIRQTELIRSTALTAATILGDYLEDIVVIGGLVPSLLIPSAELPPGAEAHAGTMDLDIGLDLAILDGQRYEGIAERLGQFGFQQDRNEKGNEQRQRWIHQKFTAAKIEFLIPRINESSEPGRLQSLERNLAAFITDGLEVAFPNRVMVDLNGKTLLGETASRRIPVCNPGAFVVLKALAFRNRGSLKDAYDLYYMVRNYGRGVDEVAEYLKPLATTEPGRQALSILRDDFLDEKTLGPQRVALFIAGQEDAETQADVVGFISELIRKLE